MLSDREVPRTESPCTFDRVSWLVWTEEAWCAVCAPYLQLPSARPWRNRQLCKN